MRIVPPEAAFQKKFCRQPGVGFPVKMLPRRNITGPSVDLAGLTGGADPRLPRALRDRSGIARTPS